MKKGSFLSTVLALAGAADVAAATEFDRIDRAVNANVCDNWDADGDYADGDFDVVGYDDVGASPRGGRGRSMPGGHPAGRGGRSANLSHRGGGFGRGGMGPGMGGRGMGPGTSHPGNLLPPGAPSPPWFQSAFGVSPNTEQMHILPLTPQTNGGVFSAAVAAISYQARPQRPFRGERPLVTLQATGASAVGVQPFSTLITVGVIPQQVEIGNIPITLWAATAFGVRLAMTDAAPGVLINFPVQLPTPNPIAGADTLLVQIALIGRVLA